MILRSLVGIACFLLLPLFVIAQSGVGIGTNLPHVSAQLDITSNNKGLLIPRLTQVERDAIAAPATGLMIFNTTTNSFQYYTSGVWNNITHSGILSGINNKIPRFTGPWGLAPGLMTDNNLGISINTSAANPDPSAMLDISSNSKGVLVPRMSSTERMAISAPSKGLLVFDNTTSTFWFYNSIAWIELNGIGGGGDNWEINGTNIYNTNTGNIGIGVSNPTEKLTVAGTVVVDQNNMNSGDFEHVLKFGSGPTTSGIGSNRIAGTTKYGLDFFTKEGSRLRIDTNGNIGIGGSPSPNYKLFINGNAYIPSWLMVGPALAYAGYALDVNGHVIVRNSLSVTGSTVINGSFFANSTSSFDGNMTAAANINVGGGVNVDGQVTVDDGKGIIRSNNSVQQVVVYPLGNVGFTNAPPGHSQDVSFVLPNVFSSAPRISVANVTNASGNFEHWHLTVHSIDIVAHTFLVRFFNASSTNSTMTATFNFIAMGAAL